MNRHDTLCFLFTCFHIHVTVYISAATALAQLRGTEMQGSVSENGVSVLFRCHPEKSVQTHSMLPRTECPYSLDATLKGVSILIQCYRERSVQSH
jgi:hypothetical protein